MRYVLLVSDTPFNYIYNFEKCAWYPSAFIFRLCIYTSVWYIYKSQNAHFFMDQTVVLKMTRLVYL